MKHIKNSFFRNIISVVLSLGIVISGVFGPGSLTCRAADPAGTYYGSKTITGAAELAQDVSDIHLSCRISESELKSMFPTALDVSFSDGSSGLVPVSWASTEDYSEGEYFFYVYDPVITGFDIAAGAYLPYIVVWIDEADFGTIVMAGTDGGEAEGGTDVENTATHLQDLIRDVEVDKDANEREIYEYLRNEMGLNQAAATGVLANINAESGYRQNALGDRNSEGYFTSYGICQWHNSRWENLINFGITNDVDWQSIQGQMMYLQYELEHGYKYVLNALRAVENTDQGTYDAAYVFCKRFEVPANTERTSDARGRVARDRFWPRFGGFTTSEGEFYIWKNEDGHSFWYENDVRQGTYDDDKGVRGDGTIRGREIYDPLSDGWYWLDAIYDGAKAVSKEVWMPYVYQDEKEWDDGKKREIADESDPGMEDLVYEFMRSGRGKWVRYDEKGKMLKGWVTIDGILAELYPNQAGNTYYYDTRTGLMARGDVTIDGVECHFDEITGKLLF